ncbi:MAG TPA: 3'-5' exonuclease [Gemmatimonadaceae bacterium]
MKDILLIDFETTGTNPDMHDPAGHDPVQLAAIRLDGRTLEEKSTFVSLIRPERPENADEIAMKLHGIPMDVLMAAPQTRDVLFAFECTMFGAERALSTNPAVVAELSKEVAIAAQFARFDIGFLRLMYRRIGLDERRFGRDDLCTRVIAQFLNRTGALVTEDASPGLDAQRKALGLPAREGAHDALEDVRFTAEVLRLHIERARRTQVQVAEHQALLAFLMEKAPRLLAEFDRGRGAVVGTDRVSRVPHGLARLSDIMSDGPRLRRPPPHT